MLFPATQIYKLQAAQVRHTQCMYVQLYTRGIINISRSASFSEMYFTSKIGGQPPPLAARSTRRTSTVFMRNMKATSLSKASSKNMPSEKAEPARSRHRSSETGNKQRNMRQHKTISFVTGASYASMLIQCIQVACCFSDGHQSRSQ